MGLIRDRAGVESVKPTQGIGRAVAGSCPCGVACPLREAVWHMKADLVSSRHCLNQRDAGQAQPLVLLQSVARVGIAGADQAGGERRSILNRLRRPMSKD